MSATRAATPRNRLALLACTGICAAVLIGMCVSYVMLMTGRGSGPKQTDFVPYYSAARMVDTGHGADIFDRTALGARERALVYPLHVKDGVMPFLYPAYAALALAPLGLLPYEAAYALWILVNLLAFVFAMIRLTRYAGLRGPPRVLLWLASLSFFPVLLGLAQGQVSPIIFALLTGAFLAAEARQETAAGMLLALACIKPPYALALLAVFVLQRRWRLLAGWSAGVAVLFLAPATVLGAGTLSGFADTLVNAAGWTHQIGGFEPRFNQSFTGFANLVLPGGPATLLVIAAGLAAGASVAWSALRGKQPAIAAASAMVCGLLAGPHVLLHDLTLLILPACIAVRETRTSTALYVILGAVYAGVIAGLAAVGATHVQLSVLAMSAFFVWLVRQGAGGQDPVSVSATHVPPQPSPLMSRTIRAHR